MYNCILLLPLQWGVVLTKKSGRPFSDPKVWLMHKSEYAYSGKIKKVKIYIYDVCVSICMSIYTHLYIYVCVCISNKKHANVCVCGWLLYSHLILYLPGNSLFCQPFNFIYYINVIIFFYNYNGLSKLLSSVSCYVT